MSARETTAACTVCEVHTESVYRIEGMDCHEEVQLLERRLGHLPGLEGFSADILNQRLRVTHDAARLTAADVADAVNGTGMRAWLEHEQPGQAASRPSANRVRLLVLSGAALAAGQACTWLGFGLAVTVPLYLASIAAGGVHTARRGWTAIRALALDINALMLLAVIGAAAIGQWSEAAAVIFLFALAQWLETRSMDRVRHAIRALMDVTPSDALVRRDGRELRVPVDDLSVGETIIVTPGERIPIDGRIAVGASDVNQSPITGESLPVEKRAGDEVFAGTINGHGALEILVTKLRRDTTMARIINLVEVAQAQRAPSQTFVERFARVYTPAVIAIAALVAVVPPLLLGLPFTDWLYRALVLLVISCPCALVISTPVSVVSALAGAARRGVLIKGGIHLERAARVKVVAFDKTGTLTHGRPEVVEVIPLNGAGPSEVLRLAAALEARSEHPLAQAVIRRAREEGAALPAGEGFRALPGLGAEATVDGRPRAGRQSPAVRRTGALLAGRRGAPGRAGPGGPHRDPRRARRQDDRRHRRRRRGARGRGRRGVGAEARGRVTGGDAHRRQPPDRRRDWRGAGDRRVASRAAAAPTRCRPSATCGAATAPWRWLETASTTRRRSPRPTPGSPWARPAPTPRSRRPTWR